MILRKTALALIAALAASALAAQQATQKFEWNPVGGIQDVKLEVQHIVVGQVAFDLGSTLKGTPVRKSSAKATLRVDNNGFIDAQVGVAVVVFDGEGNIVATGSGGTQWGYLNKGDRSYYKVSFPYVYRNFEKAKTFLITIEVEDKGRDKDKAKAEPTPAPTPSS
jgi:hypothetical protein